MTPLQFQNDNGETITVGSILVKNIFQSWVIKMQELISQIAQSNGSFCTHDMTRIRQTLVQMGKIYHLIIPNKVRPSGHRRLAHMYEQIEKHGANIAGERIGEHSHQPYKSAARDTTYVPRDKRLTATFSKALKSFSKYNI